MRGSQCSHCTGWRVRFAGVEMPGRWMLRGRVGMIRIKCPRVRRCEQGCSEGFGETSERGIGGGAWGRGWEGQLVWFYSILFSMA